MLFSILSAGYVALAVPVYDGVEMQFGDPGYPATPPESLMTITGGSGSYTANYTGSDSAYYYPDRFSLYVNIDGSSNETLEGSGGVQFATYSGEGEETLQSSITRSTNGSDLYTVKTTASGTVTVKDGSTFKLVLSFSAPLSLPVGGGVYPSAFNGYLPVGQYATGSGWGSPYSNGTTHTGTTPKITGGYGATGVSLGMLGGYAQYTFPGGLVDDSTNPYGIDFVVYGNPFNGNPEAGSVMVSAGSLVNGQRVVDANSVWYNLAGSLHYDTDTTWNNDVSYVTLAAANTQLDAAFTSAGTYYSLDFDNTVADNQSAVNTAIGAATWTRIATATAWWPIYGSAEYYGDVWSLNNIPHDSDPGSVTWHRAGTAEIITYCGLTRVKDDAEKGLSSDAATNYYKWGYADVRGNGTSYGNAVNPYQSLPASGSGGDGFDLAWAVNTSGYPVDLDTVYFVRVYSSVLYNAGVFGETSTELCGIYTANGTGSGAGSAPSTVSMSFVNPEDEEDTDSYTPTIPANMGTTSAISTIRSKANGVGASTFNISVTAVTGAYVYVNDKKLTEVGSTGVFTGTLNVPASTQDMRVVVQSGTASPYLWLYT
jgi:hypothetical protein